jgi:hypothetical protein
MRRRAADAAAATAAATTTATTTTANAATAAAHHQSNWVASRFFTKMSTGETRNTNPEFYVQRSSGFCWTPPCSVASFEVNSEPHTGACPSVRLCVGLIKGHTS